MPSSTLKLLARIQLKKNFWPPVSIVAIFIFIYTIFSIYYTNISQNSATLGAVFITLGLSFIFSLIFNVFIVGLYKYFLNQAERKDSMFSDLLYGIKNSPDRIIAISLLKLLITRIPLIPGIICICLYYINGYKQELLVAAGVFLLVIGGIICYILSLGLSQSLFIAADNNSFTALQALRRSFWIMKGSKERLFILQLSFIPLFILSIFTMYLGFFIAIPYYIASTSYFYLDLNRRIQPMMFFRDK